MKDLLEDARNEIVRLRRQNELLTARIAIVEVFAAALGLKREERGMVPDVVWALDKEVERLRALTDKGDATSAS